MEEHYQIEPKILALVSHPPLLGFDNRFGLETTTPKRRSFVGSDWCRSNVFRQNAVFAHFGDSVAWVRDGMYRAKAFLHSYQLERWRIGSWLMLPKGEVDEQKSYQVRQALLGLQVGGWFGQGFFQSRQKHLFLPSAHNDFIFAVIGEEFGFIGSVAVLTFFTLLAYFGLWVTSQTTDAFASGLSGGITVWVWFQALLHIAVNTHLLPPTGVPLPFVSAGGSALCAILIGMGLLLNVASNLTQQRKQKQRGGTNDALGDGRWGTGGHIYPALALAAAAKTISPDIQLLFVGATYGLEQKIVPQHGYRLLTVTARPFPRRLLSPSSFLSVRRCFTAFSKPSTISANCAPKWLSGREATRQFVHCWLANWLGLNSFCLRQTAFQGEPTSC